MCLRLKCTSCVSDLKEQNCFVTVWSQSLVFLRTKKKCLNQNRLLANCFTKIRLAVEFMNYFEDVTCPRVDMNFIVEGSTRTSQRSERMRYRVEHDNKHTNNDVFDDFPKISDHVPEISEDFPKLFERSTNVSEHFPKIAEYFRR